MENPTFLFLGTLASVQIGCFAGLKCKHDSFATDLKRCSARKESQQPRRRTNQTGTMGPNYLEIRQSTI